MSTTVTRFVICDETLSPESISFFSAKINGYVSDLAQATQYATLQEATDDLVSENETVKEIDVVITLKDPSPVTADESVDAETNTDLCA